MSLWLCRKETVTRPYLIEILGIRIYSSQELSYVIYHNPLLVLDDFVSESLIVFIRDELQMPFLAAKLEKWKAAGENPDDLLLIILQECGYYQTAEINQFRSKLAAYRKMHPGELGKLKADALFQLKQYGRAIDIYERLLQLPKDQVVNEIYLGMIWNNLGAAYGRMFQLEPAWKALEIAYAYTKDLSVLGRLYQLTKMDERFVLGERYQTVATEELREQWDEEFVKAIERAEDSEELAELDQLFDKDPIKRMAGAEKLVYGWRQEYRRITR